MKKRLFSALAALLASGGLAHAQPYYPPYPPPAPGYAMPYAPAPYGAVPYGAVPHGMAYPAMHSPAPVVPGVYLPGSAPVIGRATVSDPRPVVHGWPLPPNAPGTPGNPIVLVEPSKTDKAKADKAPAVHPIPTTVKEGSAAVTGTPVGHRKHTHAAPPVIASDGSCGPECRPSHPLAGVPLMCEVDCHGQPIVERDLKIPPRGYHVYARSDFLYWWVDTQESPTLLSVTRPRGAFDVDAGFPDTGERIGSRTTLGIWLDSCHTWGLEGSFLWLANRYPRFNASSPDVVTRPFFNLGTGANEAFPVLDAAVGGTASVETSMRFHTAELNLRRELCRFGCGHLDLIGGFRYLQLAEGLQVNTAQNLGGGASLLTSDRFSTRNHFYGGQLGLDGEVNWGRIYLNPYGKVALGINRQVLHISGNRVGPDANGVPASVPGGFLALPSNIGSYRDDEISIVPEFGFNVGLEITKGWRIMMGYSALMLNNAARPGEQVDRNLNLTQLPPVTGGAPTPAGPLGPFRNAISDQWFLAQGVSFGIEIRW